MKNKDKSIYNFILREVQLEISPMLESLIYNPRKLESLNRAALEKIVREFAPIYKKWYCVLDGSNELAQILNFQYSLIWKLDNKPELREYLEEFVTKN